MALILCKWKIYENRPIDFDALPSEKTATGRNGEDVENRAADDGSDS